MTDYRKILMLRSMGCSQREMERNKIASRETSKAVFETADRLGIAGLSMMTLPMPIWNGCSFQTSTRMLVCMLNLTTSTFTGNWLSLV